MNTIWEILYGRQMALHYVAPPICEVVFSGSSSPVIVLADNALGKVTGLVLGGAGGFTLSWNAFPGALCYTVYFIGGDNIAVPLAQCIPGPFELPPNGPGELVVTGITLEGETPPSDPVPYPTGGTFTLLINSEPDDGAPFSLGPTDIHGAGSGVTPTAREFNTGQRVYVTAELTHNFAAFNKWLLNGALHSQNLSTSVFMNANYTLTAVYACDQEDSNEVPADFTLSGPTSLGIFQVPPGLEAVVISGSAAASSYDIIYRGGSIQSLTEGGCLPSPDCPECCFLPPGCFFKYNGGADVIDVSETDTIEDHCVVDQETVEAEVPVGKLFQVAHTGGSIVLQWDDPITLNSVEFPITEFECGNTCPQWEIIQDTGLIAQPSSWHIRDYAEWIDEVLPMDLYNMGEEGCADFNSANYPLQSDPDAIAWDGTSTQGFVGSHSHNYSSTNFDDGIDQFIGPGPDFFPIAISGFEGSFAQVVGPKTQAEILIEIGPTFQTDPFPPAPNDRYWFFVIWGADVFQAPIWAGVKANGLTPLGPYQRISCACLISAPACMYLESGE